jgi:hypothetical protein
VAKNIIPPSSLKHARFCAQQRREWLLSQLAEYDNEPPRRVIEETPPDMKPIEHPNISDYREECLGQFVRLRWQLNSDVFILLERVTDAVLQIFDTKHNELLITVKIEPLRKFMGTRDLFPWRVVVYSNEIERIIEGLTPLADWLGVGVDVEYTTVSELLHLGRCSSGNDGSDGLLGGIMQSAQATYGVTCQHVISSSCASLAIPQNFSLKYKPTTTSIPDAVLLNHHTPCFEAPERNVETVNAATPNQIDYCMLNRIPVRQTHPHSQGKISGVVRATVSASVIGQQIYRFPQIEVTPYLVSYFFGLLKFPLGKKSFSYSGDSGAWIRDSQIGSWIGIVTAGNNQGLTYASDASCVLDYFSQLTNQSFLVPATWLKD